MKWVCASTGSTCRRACGDPSIPNGFSCSEGAGLPNTNCGFCVFEENTLNCCCDPRCAEADYDDCCDDVVDCCLQVRQGKRRRVKLDEGNNIATNLIRRRRQRARANERKHVEQGALEEEPDSGISNGGDENGSLGSTRHRVSSERLVHEERSDGGGGDGADDSESEEHWCPSLQPGDAAVRMEVGLLLLRRVSAKVRKRRRVYC